VARCPPLEAAILADPDDPEAYLVYADWLIEQGDPRGRLIELDVRGRGDAGAAAVRAWIAQHARRLNDGISRELERQAVKVTWCFGFWHAATVHGERHENLLARVDQLLGCESAAFLRELRLVQPNLRQPTFQPIVEGLPARPLSVLRALDLSGIARGHWPPVELGALAALPRLTRLVVPPGAFRLGHELPERLVELELVLDSDHAEAFAELLRRPWPRLARLIVRPVRGGRLHSEAVHELLRVRDGFPALRHLALPGAAYARGLIVPLAHAPLVAQLETLDLSYGALGVTDAVQLVEHWAAFRHLDHLDLRYQAFDGDSRQILNGLAPPLSIDREARRTSGYEELEPDEPDDDDY
jgi:uncharacterized protein (TIGR02996 family)